MRNECQQIKKDVDIKNQIDYSVIKMNEGSKQKTTNKETGHVENH